MKISSKDQSRLLKCLVDKRVLVTGGTGSFGETLVSLFLQKSRAREVIVYSRDEQKHVAMHRKYKGQRLKSILGDVRDLERLRLAMRGIDCVVNAAALKHVHFSEEHPMEAVATNILGAHHVCQAALEAGVKVLVSLSTDKAVEAVNVMGMSKALQERVVASYAGRGLSIGIVRYGNVLNSHGSVIPFFKKLLEDGTDMLPVTDRRMTRFVLTLEESVDLVLFALNECRDGEIFVRDLPMFRIWSAAQVMAEICASRNAKIKVSEVGIRPGEKLHETLVSSEEMRRCSKKGGYWIIQRYHSGEEAFRAGGEERSFTSDRAREMSKREIKELLARECCLPVKCGLK